MEPGEPEEDEKHIVRPRVINAFKISGLLEYLASNLQERREQKLFMSRAFFQVYYVVEWTRWVEKAVLASGVVMTMDY